jgi:predicted transcriptional regulator
LPPKRRKIKNKNGVEKWVENLLDMPFTIERRDKNGLAVLTAEREELSKKFLAEKQAAVGKTRAEAIAGFCQVPRLASEIREFLGYVAGSTIRHNYLTPLIETGRIKVSMPLSPQSCGNKYYAAEYAPPTACATDILSFLQGPRGRAEIAKHFGLSEYQIGKHIRQLIENGRVIEIEADLDNNKRPRYVASAVWNDKTATEQAIGDRERKVIEYLKLNGEIDRATLEQVLGLGYMGTKLFIQKMLSLGLITGESVSNYRGRKMIYRLKE